MLLTYQIQINIESPKDADDPDQEKVYLERCEAFEEKLYALGCTAVDIEDESEI